MIFVMLLVLDLGEGVVGERGRGEGSRVVYDY